MLNEYKGKSESKPQGDNLAKAPKQVSDGKVKQWKQAIVHNPVGRTVGCGHDKKY